MRIKISQREWGRHSEASDAYHERKARGEGGDPPPGVPIPADRVRVMNSSGGDLARGSVVGIGSRLITALAPQHLWYDYAAPAPSSLGRRLRVEALRLLPRGRLLLVEEVEIENVVVARTHAAASGMLDEG